PILSAILRRRGWVVSVESGDATGKKRTFVAFAANGWIAVQPTRGQLLDKRADRVVGAVVGAPLLGGLGSRTLGMFWALPRHSAAAGLSGLMWAVRPARCWRPGPFFWSARPPSSIGARAGLAWNTTW
ncbi:MAG: hypothetical protein KGL43_04585, partial [Burkholderiales bacterium]|nr:hypothetical protein [Burkholderiales bacterium]